jgi:HSP20 family protein
MAVIRWYDRPESTRSGQMMERLQREMNRMFSDFSGRGVSAYRAAVFPPINVTEDEGNLYVRAELPGIQPEDLEISVEGDALTLRGERKLSQTGESANYHRREREGGSFRRIVVLPVRIDPEGVNATCTNGVLTIVLPKAKETLPKQIKVKAD